MKFLVPGVAIVTLSAALAFADPAFRISYSTGVARVEIAGDYTRARYSVWRATEDFGPYRLVTDGDVLCLGSCYADDYDAVGGRTYWYRFDLALADGRHVSFGPYAAAIPEAAVRTIAATVSPNPGRGITSVRVFLAGAPGSGMVPTEVSLHDLQGRRLAVLHRGALAPGATTLTWDGRGTDGARLATGTYFLRVASTDGRTAVARVVRIR
jgi:flagellar hook capping protein FlgD